MTIEEKLLQYLKKEGISISFAAELIGISKSKTQAILNGKRKIKADELIKFCEYYGMDLSYFRSL